MYREISGYNKYEIDEYGNIRNRRTQKLLRPKLNKQGYEVLKLYDNSMNQVDVRVHRLVAMTFCDGYEEGLIVNHKDGDKLNNHCENLEWVTISENTKHAYDNNLGNMREIQLNASMLGAEKTRIHITVYKDGKYIGSYNSKYECAEALGVNPKTIYNWMHGKTKNTKGYTLIAKKGE